jgi:trigger factor
MKVTVEEISPIKKKLLIEVSNEEYLEELDEAYKKLGKKVSIKGFRKGKIPRPILERYYKQQTETDVFTHLIEHSYVKALQEQKIEPVAAPRISDFKKDDGSALSFSAEVEIRPDVAVSNYKGIKVKKAPAEVAEEEVTRELEALRQSHAQIGPVAVEAPLQSGQIALIDFVGRVDGQPFEGGAGNGVMVEVGLNRFLPDFEKGLVGMKKTETKTVSVKFPEDYPAKELAGKQADFEITLNDIKEKILPELNDDFARDLGNFDSLNQVKEKIRENMLHQKEQAARSEMYHQILDYMVQEHPFEVPEAMVESELDAMLQNAQRHLQQQRLTFEQAGITPEGFRTQNRDSAVRRIKALLLFEAVAREEKIQVQADEISTRITSIAQSLGQKPEVVGQYYREHNMLPMIIAQVVEEKVLDFLLSEAKMV